MKRLNYLMQTLNLLFIIGLCSLHVHGAGEPDVTIVEPMDSAYFVEGKEYTIVAEAFDDVGIDSVLFIINGVKKMVDTSIPYSYTSTYTSGNYLIEAKAYDTDGNHRSDYIRIYVKPYEIVPIKNTFDEVQIDGIMENVWENDTSFAVANITSGTIDDDEDLSGKFKLQYSSDGLYFIVDIKDNYVSAPNDINQISQNDGIELFLDLNNHKSVYYEKDDYHYVFSANGMKVEKNNKSTENIDFIVNKNPVGYVVEGFIPWETVSHDPVADEYIGFEIKIIDSDEGTKEGKLSWWEETSESAHNKTNVFGVAQYKDVVDETTAPGVPVVVGPADGDTAKSQTPVFKWEAVSDESGILNYELDISGSVYNVPGNETSLIPDTLASGDYTWKIRAIDKDSNTGSWSSVYNLVVDSLFNDVEGPDVPELVMPYDDADLKTAAPLFKWNAVYDLDGPVSYEIQINNSVYNVGQNTSYQSDQLQETDTTWKVRAIDVNDNSGSWSNTNTFFIKGNVNYALDKEVAAESIQPLIPELSLQGGNDGDYNTRWGSEFHVPTWYYVDLGDVYEISRIKIMWESAIGLGYHLQTSKVDTSSWNTIYSRCLIFEPYCDCDTGTWDTVFTELEETYDDHYEEEITGLSDSARFIRIYTTIKRQYGVSFWEFEVYKGTPRPDTTMPSVPTIILPASGDTTIDNTPAFKWEKVTDIHSGIEKYEISIDDSIYNAGKIDFFNAPAIMSEGNHTWKIRAIDGAGNMSEWSSTSTFTIQLNDTTAPSAPDLNRPVNDFVARQGDDVLLTWLAANDESGISGYEIMVNDSIYDAGDALNITVNVLNTGDFSWKARSIDRAGNKSSWSEERIFIVLDIDELSKRSSVNMYPNPVNDILYISGDVQILKASIIDLSGKTIQTIESENIQSIDVSGLLNGTYFLICETVDGYVNKMFVKE